MNKKESTVGRWGRFRKLINSELKTTLKSIPDTEDRIEEVLKTALALEVQTNALVRLAEKMGCRGAEEEVLDGLVFYASILESYVDVTSDELIDAIEMPQARPLFPMKGETV